MNPPSIMKSIEPKQKDIGAFVVRRALPVIGQRQVGPFVFFDHFGPVFLKSDKAMDVRPHPHINLATVTYLFDGEIMHRDSLGTQQVIRPGAINLMVAGRGIVHSERTPQHIREEGGSLHGLQLWLALPEGDEETQPAFYHYGDDDLPVIETGPIKLRVMIGTADNLVSPVKTFSPTYFAELEFTGSGDYPLPSGYDELAIYVINGTVKIEGEALSVHHMTVIDPSRPGALSAEGPARIAIIGGSALGKRHMWWNFVSSRAERIEKAKSDWENQAMGIVPGESDDVIPLPSE